jgi:hypothetical protein
MEVAPTSPTTTPSLYPNIIYERLILTAVYRIDLLVTVPDLYLVPAPYLVSTTYKDEVTTDV